MIDHQKEMDEALKDYIETNPYPKYTEDLISFDSPVISYSQPPNFENDQPLIDISIPVDINDTQDELLQDLINNKDITTLNNNLVYDNILEIKEKELERNCYANKNIYCSSLANTFNSSYVNISERSVYEDKIVKLKDKSTSSENMKWWWVSFLMAISFLILIFNQVIYQNQTE